MRGPVCFGNFVLNRETRELVRDGSPVPLSPKAYQLLEILIERRPQALSKAALQDRLWPDTFVVEKNLVNLVVELRRALGEDPAKPRFVRTVQRFGYAFRPDADATNADESRRAGKVRLRLFWAGGQAALRDGEHVLGRDPELDLFLDSPGVSRRHALLRIDGEDVTVEDLGSKNGTFVRSQRVHAPTRLMDRDVFSVGSVQLTVHAVRTRVSTQTEIRTER
jgi:DNA-binding winged helix-turn-helix (wHTH) protein